MIEGMDHICDGVSLLHLIYGQSVEVDKRSLFRHYPHKWGPVGPGLDPFTSIRRGDWKFIYFYENQSWELYNITEDISETRNLIRRSREVTEELSREMTKWMIEVDDRSGCTTTCFKSNGGTGTFSII